MYNAISCKEDKEIRVHSEVVEIIIFTNPSTRAGYDTRSIF